MTLRLLFRLFALSGAISVLSGCDNHKPERAPKLETARAVTVATVELRALASSATASGLLVAKEEAAVGAEQPGYRVLNVLVEQGAWVRAGQPLTILDQSVLRTRLSQALAQAENAKSEAERVTGLDGTGVISDEDISNRRSRARVAQAQLRELQTQAAQLTVRAPVAGIVLERTVRPGSVSSGEPMFRIVRDGAIELDAEVPEAVIFGISLGTAATVTLTNGEALNGKVRLISPLIDSATKLGRIRISLPRHSDLRVGGFASASFGQENPAVMVVPEKALQFEASGPQVTMVDEQNRARRIPVHTGVRVNGYVELTKGPPVGSLVALGGGAFVLDGDLVKPVLTTNTSAPVALLPHGAIR